jgi:hypothetical protein
MRGRRPAGPEYVDRLDGSDSAKERLKVILATMNGTLRLQEACVQLGICEQRFHQLREQAMLGALTSLEAGTPGRPPRVVAPAEAQVQALEAQLAAKDVELGAAQARAEIAVILPRVAPAEDEKKKPPGRRPRRRPPGTRIRS